LSATCASALARRFLRPPPCRGSRANHTKDTTMTKRQAEKIIKKLDCPRAELIRADNTWAVGATLYCGTTMIRYAYEDGIKDFQDRDMLPMTFR
jgi:hypothetical protein